MGYYFYKGFHVEKDLKKAYFLFKIASDKKDPNGMYSRG